MELMESRSPGPIDNSGDLDNADDLKLPTQYSKHRILRGRIIMLVIVGLFFLPALLAHFTLSTGAWKSQPLTHHGQLLTPPPHIDSLKLMPIGQSAAQASTGDTAAWQLIYWQPSHCDAACVNSLYVLQQVYLNLGSYRQRAAPLVILEHSNTAATAEQPVDPVVTATSLTPQLNHATLFWRTPTPVEPTQALLPGYLYVSDPLGNIMLKYQLSNDKQHAIMEAKGVLSDMKKLLKLSKIG